MSKERSNPGAQLIVAALFAAIGLAALYWFVTFAQPAERQPRRPYRQDYSEKQLEEALTPENLQKDLAEIAAAGAPAPGERQEGRMSGSPGFYRTEKLINDTFAAAGLDVKTQELDVVVPVTEYCEILDAGGQPLQDVQIYPFTPSGLCPVSLPNGDISAKLVQAEAAQLKYLAGNQPSNSIVFTTLDSADTWMDLAGAGVRAVIVREDEAMKTLRANLDPPGVTLNPWVKLINGHEMTYPRFLARGPIEKYAGADVKIRCKVVWQTKRVRNVIGVLSADKPKDEALVVTAFYDSNSLVPDVAPGAEQAFSVAALMEYARAMAPYRDRLTRDIVFIATAGHAQNLAGACQIMETVETFSQKRPDYRTFEDRRGEHEQKLAWAGRALDTLRDMTAPGFKDRWQKEDPAFQKWFEETFKIPAGEIHLAKKEISLQKRLDYLRAGSPVYREGFDSAKATDAERKSPANTHPLLKAYLEAKKLDTRAGNIMALPPWELAGKEEFLAWDYAGRAKEFYNRAAEYHREQIVQLNDSIAVRDMFAAYKRTMTLNLELYSGGARKLKDLCVLVGVLNAGTEVEPQVSDISNILIDKTPVNHEEALFKTIWWGPRDATGSADHPNRNSPDFTELESETWFKCGRLSFTVCNLEYYPPRICTPEDTFDVISTDIVKDQVPAVGKTILAMGFGRVAFKTIAPDARTAIFTLRGAVYGSAGTSTMVPNHPMGQNTFVHVVRDIDTGLLIQADSWRNKLNDYLMRGIRPFPILETNPYGRYEKNINFEFYIYNDVTVDAIRLGEHGEPLFVRDDSSAMQAVFHDWKFPVKSIAATSSQAPTPVNAGIFRCTPVSFFDQINPKTLKPFQRIMYMGKVGLSEPEHFLIGNYTSFFEPDFVFYIGLQDGAAGNKDVLDYRTFLLNTDPDQPITPGEPEIFGRGYLAADSPNIAMPELDAAASMIRTGEKRLQLQKKFGMADEQTLDFHERAKEWYAVAKEKLAQNDIAGAVNAAGSSLAYAINNHPVIRMRIVHAVIGILWYLGLLVPFVFFFEKLVFGFTDIRKQLVANGIIFLAVFAVLQFFHPAFQMVRSSLMILLGFVIFLLTLLVTLMVGGKFKQNIKELRGKEGQVEGADINRGGVVGTAFMLGLNNMRRRKVRTGLTCMTLVLITFVMICFTSVSNDLVSVEYATGRSLWNGILIRDQYYANLEDSQINKIKQIYGERFPIAVTKWLTCPYASRNTQVIVDREFDVGGIKISKRSLLSAAVQMDWNEPLFSGVDRFLLTNRGWFPRPPVTKSETLEALMSGQKAVNYVILPDTSARDLGITVEDVNNGHPKVSIRSLEYEVLGIIDSSKLTECLGPDGKPILPYDVNTIHARGAKDNKLTIPEDVGYLAGSQVVLVNQMPAPKPKQENIEELVTTVFCSILFPKAGYRLAEGEPERPAVEYKEQRLLVLEYLERIGEPAYYAIDGTAYYGYRQRAKTIAGLLQLLVPILIAALTVFNTMRSSVYERKNEIYVYNAVGIAPNHVFFMFMAEACVYAVVGAMCGYVLSQATGRVLTALHLTGGMNMDYSSIETIYASLTIVAAVLLSTIIPARDAARLASPSGVASWTVPAANGDTMEFNLPFTFTTHDRVAVISYFHRWLDSNGLGSSGPFFCSPPEARLKQGKELVPALTCTVWLKPYDLGVSQRLEISLPTDPETGEYIAQITLTLLSGNMASWERTVKPFLTSLRKQFLNWRATTEQDRSEMFVEAKRILKDRATLEKQEIG